MAKSGQLAHLYHCYHHRALILTHALTIMICLQHPIKGMIPGVHGLIGHGHSSDDDCTQSQTAPEMAHFQHCYHYRALMLTFLATMMIVLNPPIREMIPGVQWSTGQSNIIDVQCTQWQNRTKMAHFHHCYHHRALMLTFFITIIILLQSPIREMIPGVQGSTGQGHIIDDELTQ